MYVGDTLLGGLTAQRIQVVGLEIINFGDPDTIHLNSVTYTAIENETLLLWTLSDGPPHWDTLHRFDAQIGDHWFPPGPEFYCDPNGIAGMIEVVDTGHVEIDGMSLRFWDMNYLDNAGFPWGGAGRFVERRGYQFNFIPIQGGCFIIDYGEHLDCYSDMDINWPGSGDCDLSLNAAEAELGQRMSPFPNPGSEDFSMSLPSGAHDIILFDALGRPVIRHRSSGGQVFVDARHLASGLYSIRIDDGTMLRWVKE